VIARQILLRLLVGVSFWIVLVAGCFLSSFLHPSSLAFVGLALLYLWYVYIPVSVAAVSVVWLMVQRVARLQRAKPSVL